MICRDCKYNDICPDAFLPLSKNCSGIGDDSYNDDSEYEEDEDDEWAVCRKISVGEGRLNG